MADVKARVDAHDEQTKRLHHMLEERTTEHGAANKPLKVRVPATWSARGPLSCTASAKRLYFVALLRPRMLWLHALSELQEAQRSCSLFSQLLT